jgi:NADH-quinone oxidoreductase subunit K
MIIYNINYLLIVWAFLFSIALSGLIYNRKNFLVTLMAIELLTLAIILTFLTFSLFINDLYGEIIVIFILAVSATESVIALGILSAYNKRNSTILFNKIYSYEKIKI